MHDIITPNGLSDTGALPGRLVRALPTPLSVIPAPLPSFPRKREPPPARPPNPLLRHSRPPIPSFPRKRESPPRALPTPFSVIPAPPSRHSRVSGNPPRASSQPPFSVIPA